MIAYTGRLMLESGHCLPHDASQVNPSYRSDQVVVTWRNDDPDRKATMVPLDDMTRARGAEAVVTLGPLNVEKQRICKRYRRPELDSRLIAERTRAEARLITMARKFGVPTPLIRDVTTDTLVIERISGTLLRDALNNEYLRSAGSMVGLLHTAGIIHGDLTTSNMVIRNGQCVLIDFGLAGVSSELEARGVDIHVLFQTLESTTDDYPALKEAFSEGYHEGFPGADEVLEREQEIEKRGRYL
jgi:N6-L-threonylcarbamoyladenine synthase/protein kinase Bud32